MRRGDSDGACTNDDGRAIEPKEADKTEKPSRKWVGRINYINIYTLYRRDDFGKGITRKRT